LDCAFRNPSRSACRYLVAIARRWPLEGDPTEIIAFVEDPDGYRIELIESRRTALTG
jgi:catechol 2,3-dioxygenase-like lactoylglutathione lyase family enzyme